MLRNATCYFLYWYISNLARGIYQGSYKSSIDKAGKEGKMDDQERLINALDRIKSTIMEVQERFSEAAEVFNRKKSYSLSQLPNCQHVVEYLNYREKSNDIDDKSLTENDKLVMDGDQIKDIITSAQARFLYATKVINKNYIGIIDEEQVRKAQQEINEATLDIIEYSELLRRIYEALRIPRKSERV